MHLPGTFVKPCRSRRIFRVVCKTGPRECKGRKVIKKLLLVCNHRAIYIHKKSTQRNRVGSSVRRQKAQKEYAHTQIDRKKLLHKIYLYKFANTETCTSLLRYFLTRRPPRNIIVQFIVALISLVGHILGNVQRGTGEHVRNWQDTGTPRIASLIDHLGA